MWTPRSTCSPRYERRDRPGDVDAARRDRHGARRASPTRPDCRSSCATSPARPATRLGWNPVDGEAETDGHGARRRARTARHRRPRRRRDRRSPATGRRRRVAIRPRSPATSAAPRCRPSAAAPTRRTSRRCSTACATRRRRRRSSSTASPSPPSATKRWCAARAICATTEIRSQDVSFVLIYLMTGTQQARRVGLDRGELGRAVSSGCRPTCMARSLSGITTVTDPRLGQAHPRFRRGQHAVAVGAEDGARSTWS